MARDILITPYRDSTAAGEFPKIEFKGKDATVLTLEVQDNGGVTVKSASATPLAVDATDVGVGTDTLVERLTLGGTDPRVYLPDASAPSTTTNRLYSVSGDLYWDGVSLTGGGSLPAGTEGQMIYNNAGSWAAFSGVYWDDTDSKLGIGTTSPDVKLHLDGYSENDVSLTFNRQITGAGNTGLIRFQAGNSAGANNKISYARISGQSTDVTAGSEDGVLKFFTMGGGSESEQLRIDENGNVGIGTTAPGGKFQVALTHTDTAVSINEVGDYTDSFIISGGSTGNGDKIPLVFNVGSDSNPHISSVIEAGREASGWNTYLSFYTNSVTSGPEGVDAIQEKMRITSAGNVGIGTTAPGALLTLKQSADDNTGGIALFESGGTYSSAIYRGAGETGPLTFRSQGTDTLYIKSGNVGIGTTSPDYPLDIENTAEFSLAFQRTGSGNKWAFGSDSLQSYIKDVTGNKILMKWQEDGDVLIENGNVGIGTTTPAYPLEIKNSGVSRYVTHFLSSDGASLGGMYEDGSTNGEFYIKNATGTGTIGLDSAGNSYFNGGNVGIGTTSPDYPLDVQGPEGTFMMQWGTAAGTYGAGFADDDRNFVSIGSRSNDDFRLFTNGNDVMSLTTGGNVGIGTTAPGKKLEILDTAANGVIYPLSVYNDDIPLVGETGQGVGIEFMLRKGYDGNDSLRAARIIAGKDEDWLQAGRISSNLQFQLYADGVMSEKMRIDKDGNVGIGTTAPGYKLDIETTDITIAKFGSSHPVYFTSHDPWVGLNAYYNSGWKYGKGSSSATSYASMVGQDADGDGSFGIRLTSGKGDADAAATMVERFTIQPDGNVGIGTTSPSKSLEVESDGTNDGIIVSATGANVANIHVDSEGSSLLNIDKGVDAADAEIQYNNAGTLKWKMGLDSAPAGTENDLAIKRTNNAVPDFMVQHSTGNVGIGTTSPNEPLHVNAGAGASQIRMTDTATGAGGTDGLLFSIDSESNAYVWNYENTATIFGTNNAERMRIDSTGNVGIGTTSPSELLHLVSSTSTEPVIKIENTNADAASSDISFVKTSASEADNDVLGTIRFKGLDSTDAETEYGTIFVRSTDVTNSEEDGRMEFRTISGGSLDTTMAINSSNVGIGTTSPDYKLDVYDSNDASSIRLYNPTWDTGKSASLIFQQSSARNAKIYSYTPGSSLIDLKFATFNGSSTEDAMVIKGNGNVGIGTTSPGQELHVYGTDNNIGIMAEDNGGIQAYLRAGSSYATVGAKSNHDFAIQTNDANVMYLTTGGNVGIGTTGPGAELEVVGDIIVNGLGKIIGSKADTDSLNIGDSSLQGYIILPGTNRGGSADGNVIITSRYNAAQGSVADIDFRTYDGTTVTDLVKIERTGNVGIGTTDPQRKLDVAGHAVMGGLDADSSYALYFADTGTADGEMYIQFDDGGLKTGEAGVGPHFIVKEGGNVGIGTTSPGAKLEVLDPTTMTSGQSSIEVLKLRRSNPSGDIKASTESHIGFHFDDSNNNHEWGRISVLNDNPSDSGLESEGSMHFWTKDGTTLARRMSIDKDGNVGIGTTAPGNLLHVSGTQSPAMVKIQADSNEVGHEVGLEFDFSSYKGPRIVAEKQVLGNAKTDLVFYTTGWPGTTDRSETMRLDSEGNVGIGTTSPGAKLEVAGTTKLGDWTFSGVGSGTDSLSGDGQIEFNAGTGANMLFDAGGNFIFRDNDAGNAQRVVIESSTGNVGIGTTAPIGKLEVDNINSESKLRITGRNPILEFNWNGNGGVTTFTQDSSNDMTIQAGSAQLFMDSSSGNVGIGTTSPNQKLTVEGTISLKEQAAANADTAAYGQIWVKSDVPNNLYFTDDAGNDRQIVYVGGAFHDGFSDFVADEHIGHSTITLTAGTGLSGGGTIDASRTFAVDLNELTTETSIAAGDYLAMVDITDNGSGKITFANIESALNHDSLSGFVTNEHINHADVSITAGDGLTGGGTIAASRTINLDTPGILSVSSSNVASGNHTHEITASSSPGAAESILATNSSGEITLEGITLSNNAGDTITTYTSWHLASLSEGNATANVIGAYSKNATDPGDTVLALMGDNTVNIKGFAQKHDYSAGTLATEYYTGTGWTIALTLDSSGNLSATGGVEGIQLTSTVTTGTAPLVVASTTLVSNLNADLLDGQQGSYYRDAGNLNAGALLDARVAESNVTQHEAALSVAWSQLTGVPTYDNYQYWVLDDGGVEDRQIGTGYDANNVSLLGGTDITVTFDAGTNITFAHSDTSTQASSNNSGGTVIQDVTLDGRGHVTGLGTASLDSRYTQPGENEAITGRWTFSEGISRGGWAAFRQANSQEVSGDAVIAFDATDFVDSDYFTLTKGGAITIGVSGYYRVHVQIELDQNYADRSVFRAQLRRELTVVSGAQASDYLRYSSYGDYSSLVFTYVVWASGGDDLDVYVSQVSGSSNNTDTVVGGCSIMLEYIQASK